jgi:excisionase family DNA binding protein
VSTLTVEYRKAYYIRNREKVKAMARKWRDANPERRRAQRAIVAYNEWHPEGGEQDNLATLTAHIKGLPHVCHWCKASLPVSGWHIDHLIPLCHGGANTCGNIVKSCGPCNSKKWVREAPYIGKANAPSEAPATDQLHTIQTAAVALQVSPAKVRAMVADGIIPVVRGLGPRLTRIRPSDLSIYIAAGCPSERPAKRRA